MMPTDDQKEAFRERFRKVILMAGYKDPGPILAEWFEPYWNGDRGTLEEMLARYEADCARDGEII